MRPINAVISLLLALVSTSGAKRFSKDKDAVLLSKVRSLTLHGGKETSHRRVSAIPQLTCVGGNAKGLYDVDLMRCKNSGAEYDPEDIQWTCQASLPPEFKVGGTEVVCEGYDSAEDPYILKGSCGVEYRLVLTDAGEEKYGKGSSFSPFSRSGDSGFGSGFSEKLTPLWSVLFWGVFIAVACVILYGIFYPNNNGRPPTHRPGGGGGGFDDYHDDPPPPYSPRGPPRSKPSSYGNPRMSSSRTARNQGNTWQPGFWTGAAGGAAAGYFMGNRQAGRGDQNRTAFGRAQNGGPSSLFGGSGGSSWGSPRAGPSGSSPSPSSSRHESTGFGGTRRR